MDREVDDRPDDPRHNNSKTTEAGAVAGNHRKVAAEVSPGIVSFLQREDERDGCTFLTECCHFTRPVATCANVCHHSASCFSGETASRGSEIELCIIHNFSPEK